MPLDLDGALVSKATLRVPRSRVWSADVVLVDTPALTVGARCVLRVGDTTWRGTLRPGGDFGGTTYFTVIAGAGRWDSRIAARAYSDPGGVRLLRVVTDLARETGETVALDVADRSLGTTWTRRAGLASEALDAATGGAWYVEADGVTHIGTRPARAVTAPETLTVQPFEPHTRRATIRLADDAISAVLPGVTLTVPGLPAPYTIGSVIVYAAPGSLEVEACGEQGAADLMAQIVGALTAPTAYHVAAPMRVAEVVGSRVSVAPVPGDAIAAPVPPVPVALGYGVPGLSAVLQAGATVLVLWPGGDPARPTAAVYTGGTRPVSVAFDVEQSLSLAGSTPVGRVGDLVVRLAQDSVTHTVYASTDESAPRTWTPIAAVAGAPLPTTAGTRVAIVTGSDIVTAG